MHQKVQYLLSRFKSREWSGPAWYRCTNNKDGFPIYWELIYFLAIDLGHGAATEYKGEDVSKTIFKIYSANKKWLKDTYIGMIHSHHSMSAYHSGTDEATLVDMCPDQGFYGSLVVSSKVGEAAAFAFSYKDQFKNILIHTIDDDDIKYIKPNVPKEFIAEANHIKTKADAATPSWQKKTNGTAMTPYDPNQTTFDWRYNGEWRKAKVQPKDDYTDITVKEYIEMETIIEALEEGSMFYGEANQLFKTRWNMGIHEFYEIPPLGS